MKGAGKEKNSMTTRGKILLGIGLVAVLGSAAAITVVNGRKKGVEVRLEEVRKGTWSPP